MRNVALAFLSICFMPVLLLAEDDGASVFIPIPPEQTAEWTLGEHVAGSADEKVEKAVAHLFDLGLADPRGLPYHHVSVLEGGGEVDARGWVLPETPNRKQRYAIGWSGLIYPITSIGEAADLDADVRELQKTGWLGEEPFDNYQEETLGDVMGKFTGAPRMMYAWAAPYLLLRLDHRIEVKAGVDADDPFHDANENRAEGTDFIHPRYRFALSEPDWLIDFALLVRGDGVAAFFDKDDHLAAARLKQFDRVWAELEKRFPLNAPDTPSDDPFAHQADLETLNPAWRAILADAARRIGQVSEDRRKNGVEEAIREWENLENWNRRNPPSLYRRVVGAGSEAIEPLLECLEKDCRWTRILMNRGWISSKPDPANRYVMRVRDLAILALEDVLQVSPHDFPLEKAPLPDSRYDDAARELRAFCRKYDHAWGGELWFKLLKDEQAAPKLQLQAARRNRDACCDSGILQL